MTRLKSVWNAPFFPEVMDSAMSMVAKEGAENLVAEEMLDPSSLSPALVQRLDDGPRVTGAGSFSQPRQAQRTSDFILSQEQVTPGLQQHLTAAENRVSKALHKAMESMEIKLSGAVKQAAIDIIDNLGKEAAQCIILSQRRVDLLQFQLNYTKQQALSMLTQVKRVSDAQISDAENKILVERRRAQEAEAKLHTMQESNKKLKAELKRKWQQVEEFQRSIYPGTPQQDLQVSITEGSQRRRGNRFKGLAGEEKTQQIANGKNELGAHAISPAVTTYDRSPNRIAELHIENISSCPSMQNSTLHDAYTVKRVQMGVLANEVLPQGRNNLEVKEDLKLTGNGYVTVSKAHSQQESPTNDSGSGAGPDKIAVKVRQPHSPSEDSHAAVNQVEVSSSLMGKVQLTSSRKTDLESKLAKDSDEEKSSLTIEALYCNDESLTPQVHPGDEYQSNNSQSQRELEKPGRPKHVSSGGQKYAPEAVISIHCTKELEMDEDSERGSVPVSDTSRIPKIGTGEDKGASSHELSVAGKKEIQDGLGTQVRSPGSEKIGYESHEITICAETGVADKSMFDTAGASPVTANPNSDAPLALSPVVKSNHSGNNLPNEDAQRPQAQNESTGNQVSKRKRKQGVTISKYDLLGTDRSSKRLEADGAVNGAFDLLAATGVDAHISSRDNRRLMQGARQLFSLADRKWR